MEAKRSGSLLNVEVRWRQKTKIEIGMTDPSQESRSESKTPFKGKCFNCSKSGHRRVDFKLPKKV